MQNLHSLPNDNKKPAPESHVGKILTFWDCSESHWNVSNLLHVDDTSQEVFTKDLRLVFDAVGSVTNRSICGNRSFVRVAPDT